MNRMRGHIKSMIFILLLSMIFILLLFIVIELVTVIYKENLDAPSRADKAFETTVQENIRYNRVCIEGLYYIVTPSTRYDAYNLTYTGQECGENSH